MKKIVSVVSLASVLLGAATPTSFAAELAGGGAASADLSKVPGLLITELVPDSSNVLNYTPATDAYEFVEVYNNTSHPVNLNDYELHYQYDTTDNIWTSTGSGDVIIPPQQSIVLWIMNAGNTNETTAAFNANYGTQLVEGVSLFRFNGGGGMHNSSPRTLTIKDKSGNEIVSASYQDDVQTQKDKGILYQYPTDGSKAMTMSSPGLTAATPGAVNPEQAPAVPADLAAQQGLQIQHTAVADTIDDADMIISAAITGSDQTVTGTVYYALDAQTEFTPLPMTLKQGNDFEATIPEALLNGDQLRYYIEASDGTKTGKSQTYTVTIRPSFDYSVVPPMLITELVPDTANVGSLDGYEYMELYNNTDQPIHLQDYKLIYKYTDGSKPDKEWPVGDQDIIVPSQKSVVLWIINSANGAQTEADFNANYGSQLVLNQNLFRISNDGMENGGKRTIAIQDSRGYELVSAHYENDEQTKANKGIHYTYPDNGTHEMIMLTAGTEAATPGATADNQVPKRTVTLPPVTVNEPPVITHTPVTTADTKENIVIDAAIANPESANAGNDDVVTAMVYYKTASQSAYTSAPMEMTTGDAYRGIIPREALTEASLDYYIEVKDAANTVKSETHTVAITLPDFDASKLPPLLVTELVPNSTNVGSADGYEFIEIYNNTDKPVNFKDYKIFYRYTDSGPDADVVWPTDREDLIIPANKTLVFWIINSQNKNSTVADFNANYHTNLVENENIVKVYSDGMANGSKRGVVIGTNTHAEISSAYYDGALPNETKDNMGIKYKYPLNGTSTMLKSSTNTLGTPGSLDADQAPPVGLTVADDTGKPVVQDLTGKTSVNQSENLELIASAADDKSVKTVALFYKTDNQAQYTKRYLYQDYNDDLYHYKVYSPELIGRSSVDYYFQISDGTNDVTTEVRHIGITGGRDQANLRLNVADGDILHGTSIVKGTAESTGPDSLTMKVDGQDVSGDTYHAVEQQAYFAFDANGVNYYFKNGVTVGQEILYTFMDPINTYTTLTVPIDADRLKEGANVFSIRAGSKSSPFDDRPEENKDDFTVKNVRLVLADGTVLYDPKYNVPEKVISMGDSAGKNPAVDFNFSLPADKLGAKAYELDTTKLADGDHTITIGNAQLGTISASIKVDNTAPQVTASVAEGQEYRGNFELNAEMADASGIENVKTELDGQAIELPHATSSSKLAQGSHVFHIQVTDKVGNVTDKSISFKVPDENPLKVELVGPQNGESGLKDNTKLSVLVQDPTQDKMKVSFYKGFLYDASAKLGFKAFKNETDSEPPKDKIPAGEEAFTADDYSLISKSDGNYLVSDSNDQFPYQRFEVKLDESVKDTDKVELDWKGKSLEGRKVSLYAWSPTDKKWVMLDNIVAGNEDFTLHATVTAGQFQEDKTIQVMVQDELPVTQEPYDYSFVWMSDTQYYSESYPEIYQANVKWIVDHKDDMKIKYVIHTGDIVDEADKEYQWIEADKDMKVLEQAGVPYGALAGNHDVSHQTGDYSQYWKWFGEDRFKDMPVYGGSYQNNRGHYDLVSAGGTDFIIVYMGWNIGDEEIDWVNQVVKEHPDRKAILAFHEYMLVSGNRAPIADKIYEQVVVPNKNVFATLSGHYHDAENLIDEIDDNGDGVADRKVYQMLADYQGAEKGGLGYIRLMQFDMKNNKVYMKTYSPYLDDYNYYDPKEFPGKDEFALDVDLNPMLKRVATDYMGVKVYTDQLIGKATNAESGKEASVTWSSLQSDRYNGWYAVAEDEYSGKTISDIWSFTTGTIDSPAPSNPPGGSIPGGINPEQPAGGIIQPSKQPDGTYVVDGAALEKAVAQAASGKVEIQLGDSADSGKAAVQLSGSGLSKAKEANAVLELKTGTAALQFPANSLPKDVLSAENVTISVDTAINETLQAQIDKAAGGDSALKPKGAVISLNLTASSGDKSGEVHQFTAPVTVTLTLTADQLKSIDPNYAGVYYLNGDKAEYAGGTLKGSELTFATNHFSSFAVMEYRKSFADMTGNWAADYVRKLAAKHLVNGLDERTFGPKLAVTRADFATMAVRALGYDAEQGTASPFSDVKADAYYAGYAAKAAELGLIKGSEGQFRPKAAITREEAAAILMRMYGLMKPGQTAAHAGTDFADIDKASAWAADAIRGAQALGLVSGKGGGKFDPKGAVTRAETAKMIVEMLAKK